MIDEEDAVFQLRYLFEDKFKGSFSIHDLDDWASKKGINKKKIVSLINRGLKNGALEEDEDFKELENSRRKRFRRKSLIGFEGKEKCFFLVRGAGESENEYNKRIETAKSAGKKPFCIINTKDLDPLDPFYEIDLSKKDKFIPVVLDLEE